MVELTLGVVQGEPVPIEAPPVEAAYQLIVPELAVALKDAVPDPHTVAGVVAVIVGIGFTVTIIVSRTSSHVLVIVIRYVVFTEGVTVGVALVEKTVGLVVVFSIFQGQLNLWKVPTRKYANELYKDNDRAINLILQQDSIRRMYIKPFNGLIAENLSYGIDSVLLNDSERKLIESFIKTTDIIEIEKCEFGVLFIMRRFIDNGYGLFFVTQEQQEMIENLERFRINGYDVIGFSKITNG